MAYIKSDSPVSNA